MGWWSRLVSRHPKWILVIAVLFALASIVGAVLGMGFESDRNKLISGELTWNARFQRWQKAFPSNHNLIVVVDAWGGASEADPQAVDRARQFIDELGPQLDKHPDTEKVVWGFDPADLSPRTIRIAPWEEFQAQLARVSESRPILQSPTLPELIGYINRQFAAGGGEANMADAAAQLGEFESLITAINAGLAAGSPNPPDASGETEATSSFASVMDDQAEQPFEYLRTENGRLMFIKVAPRRETDTLSMLATSIASVRRIVDEVSARHPGVPVGLTGLEVVEADETQAATDDSILSSIIAFSLIAILLFVAFHSFRTPLLALATLLFAIAWTFGYLVISIGYLQVISVVFTVILLGLGIAYGIHLASRFELIRHRYDDSADGFAHALQDTLETIGPGIVTGALTTAAAFCTTLFTQYQGVAEMGEIAAVGVVFCLLAMVSVFPAMLRLAKPAHRHVKRMESRKLHLFEEQWAMPFVRRPWRTLIGAILVTGLGAWIAGHQYFDFDLLKLQAEGVPSVEWQERIARDGQESIYPAASVCKDFDEARDLARRYRAKEDMVAKVNGIALLFPADRDRKFDAMAKLREELNRETKLDEIPKPEALGEPAAIAGPLINELNTLEQSLSFAARLAGLAGGESEIARGLKRLQTSVRTTNERLSGWDPSERTRRARSLERQYEHWRAATADTIRRTLNTDPWQPDDPDLPMPLIEDYTGHMDHDDDGEEERVYMLQVHPNAPEGGPLERHFLPEFVDAVKEVDADATGPIVQVYNSGRLIRRSYIQAGGMALLVVFILLLFDYQNLSDSLLSLIPVAVGFTITFAVMWLLGVTINLANIIVLPLMFGIGVDAGVHMLHRDRQSPKSDPAGLTDGTGKGITITSFTTMLGFGALMVSHHRGMFSLGLVMATGIGFTLLACLVLMPALLELRRRWRKRRSDEGEKKGT